MADRCDVAVVGAGFAGLVAARECAAGGAQTYILEARDRVGGRTLTVHDPQFEGPLELGGSYFTGAQAHVIAEFERYGLRFREHPLPRWIRWRTGGVIRDGMPVPSDQWGEFERVLGVIRGDVDDLARGDRVVSQLSLRDYIERLNTTIEIADVLCGWSAATVGAPASEGAVGDGLAPILDHGGFTGLVSMLQYSPADGWDALAGAITESSGAELRMGDEVVAVEAVTGGYSVRTRGLGQLDARAVIMAVPVNVLPSITFAPTPPPRASCVFGSNAGAAVKVVLRATGVRAGCWAVGRGRGIDQLVFDHETEGISTLVGFGVRAEDIDLSQREHVECALQAFFPQAALLDWRWHDWNADPFSRGTWLTARPGDHEPLHEFLPETGTLLFAGSDVARASAGWIEGALITGADSARAVLRSL